MSYDISIGVTQPPFGYRELWDANVTYNLHGMLKAAGLKFDDLDGLRAEEALVPVHDALRWLLEHHEEAHALSPANGWGSYVGLIDVLQEFRHACAVFPDGIVSVH